MRDLWQSLLDSEQELWRLLFDEAQAEGEFTEMSNHSFDYAEFFALQHRTEKQETPADTVEVELGSGKTATFYREANELLLENKESAFYLTAEETYRLLALLHAEMPASHE